MKITVKTESELPGDKVRRRYQVKIFDLLGKEHTEVLGIFNHLPSDDGSSIAINLLSAKKTAEVELYKQEIRDGKNPFKIHEPQWSERGIILKAVLDDALSLPASDPLVYNGLQYIGLATDEEIKAIYGKGQAWIDDVRAKTASLLEARRAIESHKGVL